jgi:hypothetical protein
MEQLPASLSASEFQGAGRQAEAKVFTIMCATHLFLSLLLGRRRCCEEKRRGIFLSQILDANSLLRSESFCGEESEFFSSFFPVFLGVFSSDLGS